MRRNCPFNWRDAFIRSIILHSAIFVCALKNCKPALDVRRQAWIFYLSLFLFFRLGYKLLRLSYLDTTHAVHFSLYLERNIFLFFFFGRLFLWDFVTGFNLIIFYTEVFNYCVYYLTLAKLVFHKYRQK